MCTDYTLMSASILHNEETKASILLYMPDPIERKKEPGRGRLSSKRGYKTI